MNNTHSLAHTKWECKYHVVWIAKYRRKKLLIEVRQELEPGLRELASHQTSAILEGSLLIDPILRLIASAPKYALSQTIGYLKGKSALPIARTFGGWQNNFTGEPFLGEGYSVSSLGMDEAALRQYIQHQEAEDRRLD